MYHYFNTFDSNDPSASVTITNLADTDIYVYKDGSVTNLVTDGASVVIDFDARTGVHKLTIDTSASADYAIGSDYMVLIEGTTIDAGTVTAGIFTFSIENRYNDVNVVTVSGTAQTANDNGADINAILLDTAEIGAAGAGLTNIGTIATVTTLTNLPAITANWLTAAGTAADFTTEIQAGLATASSIAALNDIAATDIVSAGAITTLTGSVVSVDLVDVTTTNSDMRGTDSAATATALATVDTVVDGIQTDLSNGTDGLGAIKAETALILTDTAEIGAAGAGLTVLATATALATVDTVVDGIQTDLSNGTDGLGAIKAETALILVDTGTTLEAHLTDIKGGTFSGATDSLEAVRDRGDAAWTTGAGGTPPQLLQSTTIATLATQVSFTLTAGSADDDAYNGAVVVVTDQSTATQKAVGSVSDYTGSTKTITLSSDPAIFTMATGDTIDVIANASTAPTAAQNRAEMDSNSTKLALIVGDTGELQTDWANGGRLDLLLDAIPTTAMRGTDNAATATALATVDTVVDGIQTDLSNGTDGLGAIKAETALILTDTGTDIPALINGLTDITAAQVLAEINTALDTAISELGVASPTATPTLRTGLMLLYMALRNKLDVTTSGANALEVHNDAGTKIAAKALSDSGGDYSEGKMS